MPKSTAIDALATEVVRDGQALEPARIGQAIAHEVHAPDVVDALGDGKRLAFAARTLGFPALSDHEARLGVEPIDLLVVHAWKLRA
jgi:hypothetical protein